MSVNESWQSGGVRIQSGAVISCLVLAFPLSSCAEMGGESACALAFDFRGRNYYPHNTAAPVETGASLGQVPYSSCDDGGGTVDDGSEEAFSVPGVDPSVAFVVPAAGERLVFVSGAPGTRLPIEVRRALGR